MPRTAALVFAETMAGITEASATRRTSMPRTRGWTVMTSSCCAAGSMAPTTTTGGLRPDRHYAELVGGPLDGLLFDITGWTQTEVDAGVSLQAELGQFGPDERALYDPRPSGSTRLGLVRRHSLTVPLADSPRDPVKGTWEA